MGGPRLVADVSIVRHTPKSRRLADKLQELTLRAPSDAQDLEKLVDFALRRLNEAPPIRYHDTTPFRHR